MLPEQRSTTRIQQCRQSVQSDLLITVCLDSCTTFRTGLTFLNVFSARSASHCTAVCRVKRPTTLPTVAPQSQSLLADASASRHRPPGPRYWLCTLFVEPSLLQTQRSGTLYRTASETRLSAAAASDNYLRRTSSTVTQHTQRCRDDVMTARCIKNIQLLH